MAKQISENAQNFLVKLLGTTAQAGDTVTKGVFKAYEGVMDAAATVGAAATQRLLPDVSKSFQAFAETDMYEEGKNDLVNNPLLPMNRFSELYKREVNGKTYKYGDGSVIDEGVLDDIKIPLSGITNNKINDVNLNDVLYQVSNMIPAVALGAGFGQVGSLSFLGLSAGGTAAEEAFKEGATAEQALAYGTASGLVEVGTEKISDALGLMTGGKGGLLDKIIPSTTIAGRLAIGAGGEAFEEAVSEAVNPLTRRIYDENSMSDAFGSKEGLKQYGADILNSAIMGGVTSIAMAPLGAGNITIDVETKKTLTERARKLEANGKLTTEKATKLNEQIAKANANIETKLKKMNDADRAKTIQALKIKGFDADGTYTAKTYERAKYSTVGTELHNVQEIASKAGFETSTELTQDQEKVFKTVKKNLAKLQNKGLETDGIVVVKENQTNANQTFAGANADGVIFVNENRLNELNSALQTLAHESTHSLPMSFETLSLLDAVMNDEANGQAVRDVLTNYDITQEEWDAAKAAFEKGTADAKQAKIVDETGAAFSENILGNEDAMRVLTRNNSGLVVKAYNSICDAIKLKQLTGVAKSEYKLMLEYAAAFENAMTSEGIDFVPMSDDREEKETDNADTNYSVKKKAYTMDDTSSIIDNVISKLSDAENTMEVAKTSRHYAATQLYQAINATKENRVGFVKSVADYLTDRMTVRNKDASGANDAYVKSGQYEKDVAEFDILKADTRSIDVSEIRSELKEKYGESAKGILSRWAKNIATENPITVEQFMRDYGAQIHLQGITENSSAAEILNAMNERYVELQNKTEKYRPSKVTFQDKAARNRYALDMMNSILNEVDALGDRTVNVEEQYSERVAELLAKKETAEKIEKAEERAAFAEAEMAKMESNLYEATKKSQRTADLIHAIAKKADYLKGMTSRKYAEKYGIAVSALLYKNEEFRSLATAFSDIFNSKDGISPRKVRTKLADFLSGLSKSQLFQDYLADIENAGQEAADAITNNLDALMEDLTSHLSDNGVFDQDVLSYEELRAISNVLDFVTHIYTSYDTLNQDGVRKSLTEEAKKFETVQSVVKDLNRKKSGKISVKGFAAAASTPIAVAEHMDAYQHGLFTDTVERLTYDTWVRNRNRMNLAKGINKYVAEHKGYRRHLRQYMPVGNVEIQIGEFMDAYFMATQENGQLTLFGPDGGGLTFTGKDKVVTTKGTLFTKEQFEAAYQYLDQTDKDFMEMIWDVYQKGGKYIAPTDIAMHGFTLVKDDGNYYQLSRNQSEMNSYAGDASKAGSRVESVLNLKINKKRSTKARRISLQATNILTKTFKYIADVTNYNAYAVDVSNFRRLYNFKLDGEKETLRRGYDATWDADKGQGSADAYISKLMDDIQGVAKSQGAVMKEISKFRGRFAQAQLGLNLNVVLGQLASYPMALAYLDIDDLVYGVKYFFSKDARADMDNYSVLSAARADSGDAISANTLAEVTSAIGRVEGFLTNAADRATLTCLFEATVHKFTKENPDLKLAEVYEKAADYFDKKVVTRTQPTWQASDRSAWMRSDSEVMKFVMQFRSVPLKQMTEFISSVDRLHVMNQLSDMKLTDAQKAAGVKVDVKGAQKMLARVSVGIVAANVMYAMLKQLVKHITDRDDEEDNNGAKWYEQIANQFFLTTMTMFPLVGDAVAKITPALGGGRLNNYDAFSISIVDEANDLLECINGFWELADNTPQETMRWLKNWAFKISNFTGLSTRNVWNQLTGMISQFSPSTGETIDSWFYKQSSYASKMKKAVENGDEKMINTILQIQSGVDGLPSVYNSLIEKGYVDILPRSVGTSFTYDGESYEMTQKERKAFQETYTGYAKVVSDMTKTVVFKTATDEVKAKAIKAIQNTYWQMAIDETVGDETTAKLYVFSKAISIGKLAVITEACKAYSADKDDDGNTIAGSKKAKIMAYLRQSDLNQAQQAMVLAYLGYTDASAKQRVKAYINSLNISKSEKEMLFQMCGY